MGEAVDSLVSCLRSATADLRPSRKTKIDESEQDFGRALFVIAATFLSLRWLALRYEHPVAHPVEWKTS